MRVYIISLLPAVIFFIVGLLTLSDYGINWDSPAHFMRGQAHAELFLTRKTTFETPPRSVPTLVAPDEFISRYYFTPSEGLLPATIPDRPLVKKEYEEMKKLAPFQSFYQHDSWGPSYVRNREVPMHLSLFDTLSAFSNRIFYQRLGWLGDIESYHLVPLLFSTLGIFIVTVFTSQLSGSWLAGIAGGLSLAFFPLFFSESHMNLKDPISASLFAGAIWSLWHWTRSNSVKWFIVMMLFIAFSLGGKWNIVTFPFIALLWFYLRRKFPSKFFFLTCVAGVACVAFLILIWPTAWADPTRIIWVIKENITIGLQKVRFQPDGFEPLGFNLYPFTLFFTQTPPIILLFGVLGMWESVKNRKYLLILIWFFVPLLRFFIPHTFFYGGVRQFMEVLPALAVLVGIGIFKLRKDILLIIGILFVILTINIIRLHPYQNAYFNIFAGGLKGAAERNLVDWTLTYGSIYREAVDWLNANAQVNANLTHLDGSMFAISPLWLRDDISLSPNHFSAFEQKGEYILVLTNPLDPPVFAKRYPERFLKPLHQIVVDGVPLLSVYKNDSENAKQEFKNELTVAPSVKSVSSRDGSFIEIDLGNKVMVTRIIVGGAVIDCETYNAEFISFTSSDPRDFYVLNERKRIGTDTVEYAFAAEPARVIRIYPQSDDSCLSNGSITSVLYLPL